MSKQITLTGTLVVAPPSSSDSTFPATIDTAPLLLNPSPKLSAVDTGFQAVNINSPSAYVTLAGLGSAAGNAVTQGDTVYLRTKTAMLVKLTTYAVGGNVDAVLPVNGLLVLEFDATRYLVGLAVQGSGVVEWFASGSQ